MNRIRYKSESDTYQVLLTPHLKFSPSMELLVGNWDDEHLRGFSIENYRTLPEAQCLALRLPDIDWYKLVRMHVDHYHILSKMVIDIAATHHYQVDTYPRLMSPEELKEVTFNRVENLGNRFGPTYGMNDIISICIVNPWTKNLKELADVLITIPELRIKRKQVYHDKIIHLVGLTELGTTYEIKLWPTFLYNWGKWVYEHRYQNQNKSKEALDKLFTDSLNLQTQVDNGLILR